MDRVNGINKNNHEWSVLLKIMGAMGGGIVVISLLLSLTGDRAHEFFLIDGVIDFIYPSARNIADSTGDPRLALSTISTSIFICFIGVFCIYLFGPKFWNAPRRSTRSLLTFGIPMIALHGVLFVFLTREGLNNSPRCGRQ